MHNKLFAVGLLTAILFSLSPLHAVAETGDGADSPKLEIREYRFQPHRNRGYERLVLEFTRKDANTALQPKVRVTPATDGKGANIQVERAVLMGAIPESLINDSYSNKSRYLGPLTVNDDTPTSGFALHAATRSSGTTISAFWLASPPRLVIDAKRGGSRTMASEDEGVTITRRGPVAPAFDKFICFPESARVGMNVIFQPRNRRAEELKNFHINLEGTTASDEPAPAPDSIVCYPKSAQVIAALTFEMPSPTDQDGNTALPGKSGIIPPPKTGMAAPAPGTAATDDEMMLVPPGSAGATRSIATTSKPAPAPAASAPADAPQRPSASPASLLPPLR